MGRNWRVWLSKLQTHGSQGEQVSGTAGTSSPRELLGHRWRFANTSLPLHEAVLFRRMAFSTTFCKSARQPDSPISSERDGVVQMRVCREALRIAFLMKRSVI